MGGRGSQSQAGSHGSLPELGGTDSTGERSKGTGRMEGGGGQEKEGRRKPREALHSLNSQSRKDGKGPIVFWNTVKGLSKGYWFLVYLFGTVLVLGLRSTGVPSLSYILDLFIFYFEKGWS